MAVEVIYENATRKPLTVTGERRPITLTAFGPGSRFKGNNPKRYQGAVDAGLLRIVGAANVSPEATTAAMEKATEPELAEEDQEGTGQDVSEAPKEEKKAKFRDKKFKKVDLEDMTYNELSAILKHRGVKAPASKLDRVNAILKSNPKR